MILYFTQHTHYIKPVISEGLGVVYLEYTHTGGRRLLTTNWRKSRRAATEKFLMEKPNDTVRSGNRTPELLLTDFKKR